MDSLSKSLKNESSWWTDTITTDDGETYSYRATEYLSASGTSVRITFEEYGSFTSYSEEDALSIFKTWCKKNVKAQKPDLRNKVRQPSVRD